MLFDTTFLIDYEREIKRNRLGPVHSFLTQHANAPLYVSTISVGEFAEGFVATASCASTVKLPGVRANFPDNCGPEAKPWAITIFGSRRRPCIMDWRLSQQISSTFNELAARGNFVLNHGAGTNGGSTILAGIAPAGVCTSRGAPGCPASRRM